MLHENVTNHKINELKIGIICKILKCNKLKCYKQMLQLNKNVTDITEYTERSEKSIEAYLVKRVKSLGGMSVKMGGAGATGWPDRLVILPGGVQFFVELKSKGERPRATQRYIMGRLFDLQVRVYTADSKEIVDIIMKKEYEVQAAHLPE